MNANDLVQKCGRCMLQVNAANANLRRRSVMGARAFFCDHCYIEFGTHLGTDAGEAALVALYQAELLNRPAQSAVIADPPREILDRDLALARTTLDQQMRRLTVCQRIVSECEQASFKAQTAFKESEAILAGARGALGLVRGEHDRAALALGQALAAVDLAHKRDALRDAERGLKDAGPMSLAIERDGLPRKQGRSIDEVSLRPDSPFTGYPQGRNGQP